MIIMPNSMSLYEKQMKDCSRKPPVHGNLLDLWITNFRNSFRTPVSHSQPEIRFDTVEIDSFIHSRSVEATDRFYPHLLKKQNSPHSTLIKESFSFFYFASPSFVPGSYQLFRHPVLGTPVITNTPLPSEYQQGCSNSISGIWAQICLLWAQERSLTSLVWFQTLIGGRSSPLAWSCSLWNGLCSKDVPLRHFLRLLQNESSPFTDSPVHESKVDFFSPATSLEFPISPLAHWTVAAFPSLIQEDSIFCRTQRESKEAEPRGLEQSQNQTIPPGPPQTQSPSVTCSASTSSSMSRGSASPNPSRHFTMHRL